jgi:hypothetical protein
MDLDSAAEELYGVPVEEFGEHRKRLAAEAKAAGDKALAASIGKLRKPVVAAALVNELVRDQPPELQELTELGEQMREAQRQLRGPELRVLSEQRQQLLRRLTELVRDRADAAGRSVTEAVLAQVRGTFEAAIADEGAEAAALSGRLTTVLSYTGFGEVDVTDAVATPVRKRHLRSVPAGGDKPQPTGDKPEPTGDRPAAKPRRGKAAEDQADDEPAPAADRAAEQAHQRRLQRRRDELRRAEAEHAEAARALEQAERDAEAAEQQHQQSTARVEQLRAELASAQERAWQAGQASRSAERVRSTAMEEADRTAAALQTARARLESLDAD